MYCKSSTAKLGGNFEQYCTNDIQFNIDIYMWLIDWKLTGIPSEGRIIKYIQPTLARVHRVGRKVNWIFVKIVWLVYGQSVPYTSRNHLVTLLSATQSNNSSEAFDGFQNGFSTNNWKKNNFLHPTILLVPYMCICVCVCGFRKNRRKKHICVHFGLSDLLY